MTSDKSHWEAIYAARPSDELSWYERDPVRSVQLISELGLTSEASVIDVGAGDSTLVDALLQQGLGHVTVLDLSAVALTRAQARLGTRAQQVTWIEGDVTRVQLPRHCYDVWHDRAVFHFLTSRDERERYIAAVSNALRPGGSLVIATFAPDGPRQCSGLDTVRFTPETLALEFGDAFELVRGFTAVHHAPSGGAQHFTHAVLRHGGLFI